MVELREHTLRFPGVRFLAEHPLPTFCDPEANVSIKTDGLSREDQEYLGWQSSYRVLPDRLQDDFSSDLVVQDFKALVLENEHLRATFLPQLGGRLISLVRKRDERELLFLNQEIRMRNVGSRYAWFAGGIEWNWGVWGHSTFTSAPLFAARISGVDGAPALRLYEYERRFGLLGQLDFHLPKGSEVLFVCTRLRNTRKSDVPLYYWTNIAVPESESVRVLSPASEGITSLPPDYRTFSSRPLPSVGRPDGRDLSYPQNFPYAAEVFYQLKQDQYPWIAALEGDGAGLFQTSTSALRGRKLYVWGMHQGGRHWQEYLSRPDTPYIEIQAGLHRTQRHMKPIAPGEQRSWTEAFGCLDLNPGQVHGSPWEAAIRSADEAIKRILPEQRMEAWDKRFQAIADEDPEEILRTGTGWGALECERLKASGQAGLPSSTPFPASSMGPEQEPWLDLLHKGRLPNMDPTDPPCSWLIQDDWRDLLLKSVETDGGSWLAWLHLGVAYREALEFERAELAWARSIELLPNPIALRSLASLLSARGDWDRATELLEQAYSMNSGFEALQAGIAAEFIDALRMQGQSERALEIYQELPETSRKRDYLRIRRAQIALDLGDPDTVEEILLGGFSTIREGQGSLTDLWFGLWELRAVNGDRKRITDLVRSQVRLEHPLPRQIDFRLTDETSG